MIHDTVFILTAVLMAIVSAIFIFVALNAGRRADEYAPTQAKAGAFRSKLFWVLLVAGVLITIVTTLDLPYAATRGKVSDDAVAIDVKGYQWYWELSSERAKAGDTVVFHVTTADVNHGLGVYDPDMRLIGQTQAMPGYTNSLELKFDRPGAYKLMCLEYCGLAHHVMISEFTVTP